MQAPYALEGAVLDLQPLLPRKPRFRGVLSSDSELSASTEIASDCDFELCVETIDSCKSQGNYIPDEHGTHAIRVCHRSVRAGYRPPLSCR